MTLYHRSVAVLTSLSLLAGPAAAAPMRLQSSFQIGKSATVRATTLKNTVLVKNAPFAQKIPTVSLVTGKSLSVAAPEVPVVQEQLAAVVESAQVAGEKSASVEQVAGSGSLYDGGLETTGSAVVVGFASSRTTTLAKARRRVRAGAAAAGLLLLSAPAHAQSAFIDSLDASDPLVWALGTAGAAALAGLAYGAVTLYRKWKFSRMSPQELEMQLGSPSWRNRRLAVETYAEKGWTADIASTLAHMIEHDEEPRVKVAAAEAAGAAKLAKTVAPLLKGLKEERNASEVRAAFAQALGQIGDLKAVDPLLAQAKDEGNDDELREASIQALGGLGDAKAAGFVTDLFLAEAAENGPFAQASLEAALKIAEPASLERLGLKTQEELVERIRTDDDSETPVTQLLMDRFEEVVDEVQDREGRVPKSLEAVFARVAHVNAARLLRKGLQLISDDEDTERYTTTSWTKSGGLKTEHHTRDADADETLDMADDVLELDEETDEWLLEMDAAGFKKLFVKAFPGDEKGLADAAEDADLRRPYLLAAGLTPQDLAKLRAKAP